MKHAVKLVDHEFVFVSVKWDSSEFSGFVIWKWTLAVVYRLPPQFQNNDCGTRRCGSLKCILGKSDRSLVSEINPNVSFKSVTIKNRESKNQFGKHSAQYCGLVGFVGNSYSCLLCPSVTLEQKWRSSTFRSETGSASGPFAHLQSFKKRLKSVINQPLAYNGYC